MTSIIKIITIIIFINFCSFYNINDNYTQNIIDIFFTPTNNSIITNNLETKLDLQKHLLYSPIFINSNEKQKIDSNIFPYNSSLIKLFFTPINWINKIDIEYLYNLNFTTNPSIHYVPDRGSNNPIKFSARFYNPKNIEFNNLFNVAYLFPPRASYHNVMDAKYLPFLNVFPEGAIVQIKFPTDEIELIYSTLKPKSNIIDTYNEINNLIAKKYDKYLQNFDFQKYETEIPKDLSYLMFDDRHIRICSIQFELFKAFKANNKHIIQYFNINFNFLEIIDYIKYLQSFSTGQKIIEIEPPFVVYIKKTTKVLPYYFAFIPDNNMLKKYNIFNGYYRDLIQQSNDIKTKVHGQ